MAWLIPVLFPRLPRLAPAAFLGCLSALLLRPLPELAKERFVVLRVVRRQPAWPVVLRVLTLHPGQRRALRLPRVAGDQPDDRADVRQQQYDDDPKCLGQV